MNRRLPTALALLSLMPFGVWTILPAYTQPSPIPPQGANSADVQRKSDIYFNLTMGHLFEQEYEESSKAGDADRAIDFFKKAYAGDPNSTTIGEQLAEMYFISQRSAEAITEVQSILKRDPNNIASRRLLARIYVRSLGTLTDAAAQSATVNLAIDQFREIVRLDPSDSDSAIWLARLYRLTNQHDKAEQVLRDLLMRDPDNEPGVSQLTQLLLDQDKAPEAIALLQKSIGRAPTGGLYDQLGDAYAQIHDLSHAEQAYQSAVDLEPENVGHHQRTGSSGRSGSRGLFLRPDPESGEQQSGGKNCERKASHGAPPAEDFG